MKRTILFAVACVAVMFTVEQVQAGVVISPVSASSPLPLNTSGFPLINLINQSGLSPKFTSGVTDWDTYFAGTVLTSTGHWIAQNKTVNYVDFDFGSTRSLTRLAMWNYGTGGGTSSVKDFTILTSNDSSFASFQNVGSFELDNGPRTAQVFDISDSFGRYARLEIDSNYGFSHTVGFGEIVFESTTLEPTPEPTSLAIFGIGALCMGAGAARRRRKEKQAAEA
ncbi:MAG: hypothetical protein COA78_05720 [Blastopirellula sp.]|nr:MAG: hypothetical protein COA78_05720 [Blastopirellula sp.]